MRGRNAVISRDRRVNQTVFILKIPFSEVKTLQKRKEAKKTEVTRMLKESILPKLPSQSGCQKTLSRVPCAIEKVLVGYPFNKYSSGSLYA